jgi:hypothetical protein
MSILSYMPEILRKFFTDNYRRVIREQRAWEHVYECSSPDRYRLLHMMVFPLRYNSASQQSKEQRHNLRSPTSASSTTSSSRSPSYTVNGINDGLLIVHSLRVERPHDRMPLPPLDHLYRDDHGFVQQCVHCRRVLRQGGTQIKTTNNNISGSHVNDTNNTNTTTAIATATWDWIPAWLHHPLERTTHGTCGPCSHFYFSDDRMESSDNQFPTSFVTGEVTQYPPASLPESPQVERWALQWRNAVNHQR